MLVTVEAAKAYRPALIPCRYLGDVEVSDGQSASALSQEGAAAKGEPSLGDIQELLKKIIPGGKVRVTHSIWPRNPGNGTKCRVSSAHRRP